ncbi:hypothetical protein M422DRAFT_259306 [Sphaerobolus stellatus SS14]|uniref:Unplaced genomic scaffold SPHSTscaffold_88, whole genome shotgun sequence n=1 Tax=Sphaerobolus stellatus (strain SS14) TaxID=990650 RepID=A0A0C9U585_SPHS4|nr:hypothetical protein M422DRAFT_259306 [Sphaerobolus stellatus SS14]
MINPERLMGPNKQHLLLGHKFQYITQLKLRCLGSWFQQKQKDLAAAEEEATTFLASLPPHWDEVALCAQWDLQQEAQLSAKTSVSAALVALNQELDKYEYRLKLIGRNSGEVLSLYEASNALQVHHQDSMSQLQNLTANLGLLQMPIPASVSEADQPLSSN